MILKRERVNEVASPRNLDQTCDRPANAQGADTRLRRDALQRCRPLLRGGLKGSKKARFLDRTDANGQK